MSLNNRRSIGVLAVVVAWLMGAPAALAQGGPAPQARPYRSLFGGAAGTVEAPQMLDLSLSLAEAYDANVLGAAVGAAGRTSPLLEGGLFSALSADLRYSVRGRRGAFSANAGTNIHYFSEVNEVVPLGQYVGAGVSVPLGRKTTFSTNHGVTYMPSYLQGLFASPLEPALGDVIPPATNLAVNERQSYSYQGMAEFNHEFTRRTSLSFHGAYRNTTSVGAGAPRLNDFSSYNAGGRFNYGLTREMRLRLGYSYTGARYSLQRRPVQHNLDLGVDYDRPLSRSRRTRVGFSFGSAVIEAPFSDSPTAVNGTQIRATGDARLSHQIGRTWSLRAVYRRDARFVEELSAPAFTDAITFSTNGFLNRRADVSASASYSSGTLVSRVSSPVETYSAEVRLRVGLTNKLAAFGEYLYYFYDVPLGFPLTSTLPPRVSRNGVRLGIAWWLPVIQR